MFSLKINWKHSQRISHQVISSIKKETWDERWGFIKALYDNQLINNIKKETDRLKKLPYDKVLHLGIGGSALGALIIIDSLKFSQKNSFKLIENIDPYDIHCAKKLLEKNNPIMIVVSKTGETLETISAFSVIFKEMKNKFGEDEAKKRTIIVTDPNTGFLREFSKSNNINTLDFPEYLSGRFSSLSSTGLLPAGLLNINTDNLISGGRFVYESFKNKGEIIKIIENLSSFMLEMWKVKKRTIVFMPYSERLASFSRWLSQLWGESLGKNKGNLRFGHTPVPAKGTTDQHSILQLLIDGPRDKVVFFIRVKRQEVDESIPDIFTNSNLQYLKGKSVSDVLNSLFEGTKKSLIKKISPL